MSNQGHQFFLTTEGKKLDFLKMGGQNRDFFSKSQIQPKVVGQLFLLSLRGWHPYKWVISTICATFFSLILLFTGKILSFLIVYKLSTIVVKMANNEEEYEYQLYAKQIRQTKFSKLFIEQVSHFERWECPKKTFSWSFAYCRTASSLHTGCLIPNWQK